MKIKIFLLTLISTLTFTYATSGACSGHGGVNCSAGSDSDGSVICADGWKNSSVSYNSMVKCGGQSTAKIKSDIKVYPSPVKVNKGKAILQKLKFW